MVRKLPVEPVYDGHVSVRLCDCGFKNAQYQDVKNVAEELEQVYVRGYFTSVRVDKRLDGMNTCCGRTLGRMTTDASIRFLMSDTNQKAFYLAKLTSAFSVFTVYPHRCHRVGSVFLVQRTELNVYRGTSPFFVHSSHYFYHSRVCVTLFLAIPLWIFS